MSLLEKASIITTPTAYGVGVLNSIKPAYALGDNLLSQNWTTAGDWTFTNNGTTNATLNKSTSSTTDCRQSSIGAVQDRKYRLEFVISVYTSGSLTVKFGGGTTISIDNEAVGRFSVDIDNDGTLDNFQFGNSFQGTIEQIRLREITDADFDFARTSTATRVNEDYLIETVAANIPRLDYTNGVAQILVENASTNLVTYSEDFSQWTPNFGANITSNSIVSPDGTQNASKLIPSSSVERQGITIDVTANGDISMSVFAKKGEYSVIQFSDAINGGYFINFDLQTGLIGSSNTMQGKIENVGNDWYRCSASYSSSNSILRFRLSIAESSTSGRLVDFAGNSSDGLYLWGAQLENSTYTTSYIPTSGTTITRAAETLTNAGNSDLLNDNAGTLYCEIAALTETDSRRDISFSDGTANDNVVRISFHSVTNTIRGQVRAGGVLVVSLSYVVPDTKNFHKVALSYNSSRARLFIDGVRVGLDTSVTLPTGLNTLDFNAGGPTGPFYGKCKTVAVFKEALSESEMACLTSTGNREIFLNYYYRMHYVGANIDALSCAEKTFNV